MHIVSWNVAGWKTCVGKIAEHHKPHAGAKQEEALENWMAKMDVDILCLQEMKLSKDKIEGTHKYTDKTKEGPVPYGFRSDKYDVFFSYPHSTDSSVKDMHKGGGLAGVATFVKKGLTLRASSTTLDDGADLDQEGRCIMTDHGKFVIFNVYVPNGGGGVRMPRKQAFLAALDRAMTRQRESGKQVILCGDLNIHYRPQDCFKYWRRIDMNAMCYNRDQYESTFVGFGREHKEPGLVEKAVKKGVTEEKLTAFLDYIASEWRPIEEALKTTVSFDTKMGQPNEKKMVEVTVRVNAQHPTRKETVMLMMKKPKVAESSLRTADGGLESGKADTVSKMKWSFRISGKFVNQQGEEISEEEYSMSMDPMAWASEPALLVKKSGCLDIDDLRRVLCTMTTGYFDPITAKVWPRKPADYKNSEYDRKLEGYWEAIADRYGDAAASPCDINWLHKLLGTSSRASPSGSTTATPPTMVDPFAKVRPYSVDRFTIWSQYTNERYRNEGTRIDFTLCDSALWEQYGRVGGELDGYHHPQAQRPVEGKDQSRSSLDAATNFGMFREAPMDGSGMQSAAEDAYQSHLRGHLTYTEKDGKGNLHTGIIYTPPEYSDHVGVSLLLSDAIREPGLLVLESDKATRDTQPHAKQQSIKNFFGAGAKTAKGGSSSSSCSSSSSSSSSSNGNSGQTSVYSGEASMHASGWSKTIAKRPNPAGGAQVRAAFFAGKTNGSPNKKAKK